MGRLGFNVVYAEHEALRTDDRSGTCRERQLGDQLIAPTVHQSWLSVMPAKVQERSRPERSIGRFGIYSRAGPSEPIKGYEHKP